MGDANPKSKAVIARGIVKSYGAKGVLRGIHLEAKTNQALVLFGPNGAGKTTLLRILATLSRPDQGDLLINGHDTSRSSVFARQTTGAVLHAPILYGNLTARENLLFHARMFRVPNPAQRIAEVASLLKIEARLDDRARELSNGLQRRTSLARALLHRPKLLLLDEPETGLDQDGLDLLDNVIRQYRQDGRAVVMTTHSLSRGINLADRICIMSQGKIVYEEARANVEPEQARRLYRDVIGAETRP